MHYIFFSRIKNSVLSPFDLKISELWQIARSFQCVFFMVKNSASSYLGAVYKEVGEEEIHDLFHRQSP